MVVITRGVQVKNPDGTFTSESIVGISGLVIEIILVALDACVLYRKKKKKDLSLKSLLRSKDQELVSTKSFLVSMRQSMNTYGPLIKSLAVLNKEVEDPASVLKKLRVAWRKWGQSQNGGLSDTPEASTPSSPPTVTPGTPLSEKVGRGDGGKKEIRISVEPSLFLEDCE